MKNHETTLTAQAAAVAEPGATVAAEKAPTKRTAVQKKAAPKGQKSAKGGKAKASPTAKGKKTTPAKKAAKSPSSAGTREGSKTAQVVAMLQRKNGATLAEIMDQMSWQKHTVRGFISVLGSKHGLKIESTRRDDGARLYAITVGGAR